MRMGKVALLTCETEIGRIGPLGLPHAALQFLSRRDVKAAAPT
jgi:hypothetical protein